MKINHYSLFNSELVNLDWNQLRDNKDEPSYHVPFTKEDYIAKVESQSPSEAVHEILNFINKYDCKRVLSIGLGIGYIEYQLKKLSGKQIFVSDTTTSIERVGKFGIYDNAYLFNVLSDEIPVSSIDMAIFPRIDTEFTDEEMMKLFEKFHQAGVSYICFIPTGILNFKVLWGEFKILLLSLLRGKKRVFCGYNRNIKGFSKTWKNHYQIEHYHPATHLFFLKSK